MIFMIYNVMISIDDKIHVSKWGNQLPVPHQSRFNKTRLKGCPKKTFTNVNTAFNVLFRGQCII